MAGEESSGGDAGASATDGIGGSGEVTGDPGESGAEVGSGTDPSAGETDGVADTGDPTASDTAVDTGVPACDANPYNPVDLDIYDEFGDYVDPQSYLADCTGSVYFDGPHWQNNAGGRLSFNHCGFECDCNEGTLTVDFHGTYSVPPEYSGCGSVELWPGFNNEGDCVWIGMAVFRDQEDPDFVINNTLRLPVDAPIQPDMVDDDLCDTDVMCNERTPGRYALRFGTTEIPEGHEAEDFLAGQTLYSIRNRSSTITGECDQWVAWTAEAFDMPGPGEPPGP